MSKLVSICEQLMLSIRRCLGPADWILSTLCPAIQRWSEPLVQGFQFPSQHGLWDTYDIGDCWNRQFAPVCHPLWFLEYSLSRIIRGNVRTYIKNREHPLII
ncbi:hypothetical protein I7I50_12169 [Histoplasma capsulatum G186AR]|uniref:Uncharacterized protein n=1 Tax=Ajellomyces capsulatus TaxID=5037 RepID=A0A8H8CS24_AJECA|nr:hypothetical protein I7I52_11519 [Histoplasma capsulatum]QSS70514.1 hypothetical protein I7I50_12169 [Histoplasma capsulatum G186AR]